MLKWKIEKNVISELYLGNENLILPWGVETADSSAFFSLEQGVGWRHSRIDENYQWDDREYRARVTTKMKEGLWRLDVQDQVVGGDSLVRRCEIECLEDSVFMDFVMRFRFRKNFFEYAEIAGNRYVHNNTNIYYQFPVSSVYLKGHGFGVEIRINDALVPEQMTSCMYVRDYKDEWVVHARMLPTKPYKNVIKLCNRWTGTRPLPQFLSNMLLTSKSVKSALWYRSEHSPYQNKILRILNPNAFSMVKLPIGERLMWNISVRVL
ncbi:hypothetical protein EG832_00690 [bacterium]|nr:hypothetical protein [bacterium]